MTPMDTPSITPRNAIRLLRVVQEFDCQLVDAGDHADIVLPTAPTHDEFMALAAALHRIGVIGRVSPEFARQYQFAPEPAEEVP